MVSVVMPLSADTSFWQPLTWELPATRRTYCMRPEWSTCGESAWMLLSKFSWCNRLPLTQLGRLLAPSAKMLAVDADLRRADRINIDMMQRTFGLPEMALRFSFCVDRQHHQLGLAETELRYCSKCLHQGFHTAIFQWRFFTHCPIHKTSLRTGCPDCGIPISYRLDSQLADSPLRCVSCRNWWVPLLDGPAGRCTPLATAETHVFESWASYIAHAIGPAGNSEPIPIDPKTGCFSDAYRKARRAQEMKRFAYIAILNRLYPIPPQPQVKPLDNHETFIAAATLSSQPDSHALPLPIWPQQQWRRFNATFIGLEAILNSARNPLLDAAILKAKTLRFKEHCIAPASALHITHAATLGWCMSWYGYHRPASIFQSFPHPAFGLAAWLAHIPDRPIGMRRARWHVQIAQWLRNDLAESWRAWHYIAAFMHAHSRYFFHPVLAQPSDFALAWQTKSQEFTSIAH